MNSRSIRVMLLGIIIMLLGGTFILDSTTNLGGFEIVIVLVGFIVGTIGFFLPG